MYLSIPVSTVRTLLLMNFELCQPKFVECSDIFVTTWINKDFSFSHNFHIKVFHVDIVYYCKSKLGEVIIG